MEPVTLESISKLVKEMDEKLDVLNPLSLYYDKAKAGKAYLQKLAIEESRQAVRTNWELGK